MLKPGFEKQVSLEECRRLADEKEPSVPLKIRAKVRFDYRGKARPPRFFFGGKRSEEAAVDLRQQQEALWHNVPVQGVYIQNIVAGDIYTVFDDEVDNQVAYAPLELEVLADSLCHLVRFAVRDEFRRIKVMEPAKLDLSIHDMEQVFFQINEQTKTQFMLKAKRYQD